MLNVFLVFQLIDRQEEELSFIPEPSREEELEFNIEGLDDLSEEQYEAPLVYAQSYEYNEVASNELSNLPNQQSVVINDTTLFSRFEEPVSMPSSEDSEFRELFNQMIYNGADYSFWKQFDQANLYVFVQEIEHPIFYNPNALLFVQTNDNGEIVQYIQTQLIESEEDDESLDAQNLIQQYDAVYRLYHNTNTLESGDEITDVHLGYHNLVSLQTGEQLLNPTWHIEVNEQIDHFINAIEGHDYPQNEDFVSDNMNEFINFLTRSNGDHTIFYQLEDEDEEDELIEEMYQDWLTVQENLTEVE